MDFRKIRPDEFDAVLDLVDRFFPVSREHIISDLRIIQQNPRGNGEIHGLFIDGKLIATACYGRCYGLQSNQAQQEMWDGEGCLRYLVVDEDHRRQKYATWIVDKIIHDLKDAGAPCLAVAALAEDEIAVRFWEKRGFEHYDTFKSDEYGTHRSYVLWFERNSV